MSIFKALAVYWIIGCLLVGSNVGYRVSHHSPGHIDIKKSFYFVLMWPMIFTALPQIEFSHHTDQADKE